MSDGLGRIHGVVERLAEGSTAIANLCALRISTIVPEHGHANPYLSLHLLGGYREAGDGGEQVVSGPAAMFFAAGSAHGMAIGAHGLASVIIEFDAGWLRRSLGPGVDLRRSRSWVGGPAGQQAAGLARQWLSASEPAADCLALTAQYLVWAMRSELAPTHAPPWLSELDAIVESEPSTPTTAELARRLGLSAPWMAHAYRRSRGEGLGEATRRRRVASAAAMLEDDGAELADVAIATGFCDQSHMTRAFKRLIGRTPAAIRDLRLGLARPSVGGASED